MFTRLKLWWLSTLLRTRGDTTNRMHAAECLGKLGDPRAVAPLLAALSDRSDYVRQAAAEALGKLGDPRAVEPLVAALGDSDSLVRYCAAEALRELGAARAVKPLSAALRDSSQDVRREAAKLLRSLRWEPVDAGQRVSLAIAEGRFKDVVVEGEAAVEPLLAVLRYNDKAAAALVKVGAAHAVKPLVAALGNSGSDLRYDAAKLLRSLRWEPADAGQRVFLAIAEGRWKEVFAEGETAVKPLVAALGDSSSAVRHNAAEVLRSLHWEPADAGQRVSLAIAERRFNDAVAEGETAVEPLAAMLREPDFALRRDAALLLGKLAEPRAVFPLIKLSQSCEKCAVEAIRSLRLIRDRAAARASTHDLILILSVYKVYCVELKTHTDNCLGNPIYYEERQILNCSDLRQLARQELIRRAIKA